VPLEQPRGHRERIGAATAGAEQEGEELGVAQRIGAERVVPLARSIEQFGGFPGTGIDRV
jgi:hypothetical protein